MSSSGKQEKHTRKFITTLFKTMNQIKVKSFDEIKSQVISDLNSFTKDITTIYDDNNDTLGHLTVKEDKLEPVHLIIESYLHILGVTDIFFDWLFRENAQNQTLFDICAYNGNKAIIKYLYSVLSKTNESKLRLTERRNNIFHYAAQNNQCYPIIFFYEKLQNYFKEHLIIDIPNQNGITPFLYACIKGSKQVMDLLLDLGVNINAIDNDGNTCLHYAVMSNSRRVVKKLLVRGANRNIKNKEGQTPYDKAKSVGYNEVAECLLIKNALQTHCCGHNNITAIKGNKNNLILLFLVMLLLIIKIIYITNVSYIYSGDFKRDFIPFVPLIEASFHDNDDPTKYPYNFSYDKIEKYTDLFNHCIIKEDKHCFFEIGAMGLSLAFDITMLFVIVPFLICSMNIYEKKKSKKKTPSLAALFEEDKAVCVKCRSVIDSTTIHCIVCNACVKNFDHHCVWLNTCINSKNISKFKCFIISMLFFFLFNLLLFILNIIAMFTTIIPHNFYSIIFKVNCTEYPDIIENDNRKCYQEETILNYLFPIIFFCFNFFLGIGCLYALFFILIPVLKVNCKCNKKKTNTSTFEDQLLSDSKASEGLLISNTIETN